MATFTQTNPCTLWPGARVSRLSHPGCLPCTTTDGSAVQPKHEGACLACLVRAGRPFLLSRPSMGCEAEAACLAVVPPSPRINSAAFNRTWRCALPALLAEHDRALSHACGSHARDSKGTGAFSDGLDHHCQHQSGVPSVDPLSLADFGACYALAINISDASVRIGGGRKTERRPVHACSKHTFQKGDTLMWHAGHFPDRVFAEHVITPWLDNYPPGAEGDASEWLQVRASRKGGEGGVGEPAASACGAPEFARG